MRILGYSVEGDGSVGVTIFEPPEESGEELEKRGWNALQTASTSGKKGGQSRWCKKHQASMTVCACPPWEEQAHRLNAALIAEKPTLNGVERAKHISEEIGLAFRTVEGEISSPGNRAEYKHLYQTAPSKKI